LSRGVEKRHTHDCCALVQLHFYWRIGGSLGLGLRETHSNTIRSTLNTETTVEH
jgi:hypothetical protein